MKPIEIILVLGLNAHMMEAEKYFNDLINGMRLGLGGQAKPLPMNESDAERYFSDIDSMFMRFEGRPGKEKIKEIGEGVRNMVGNKHTIRACAITVYVLLSAIDHNPNVLAAYEAMYAIALLPNVDQLPSKVTYWEVVVIALKMYAVVQKSMTQSDIQNATDILNSKMAELSQMKALAQEEKRIRAEAERNYAIEVARLSHELEMANAKIDKMESDLVQGMANLSTKFEAIDKMVMKGQVITVPLPHKRATPVRARQGGVQKVTQKVTQKMTQKVTKPKGKMTQEHEDAVAP